MLDVTPFCICTVVSEKAISTILENTGEGTLKDSHPWIIAQERLDAADKEGLGLPIIFATGKNLQFSHWSIIKGIDVQEFAKGTYETRCRFDSLQKVHPIWLDLQSISLMPSIEQLRREEIEPVRIHRQFLNESLIHPYAICETPAFIGSFHGD